MVKNDVLVKSDSPLLQSVSNKTDVLGQFTYLSFRFNGPLPKYSNLGSFGVDSYFHTPDYFLSTNSQEQNSWVNGVTTFIILIHL